MSAAFRALTIQSGITTQVGNTTTLLVGQGIDTNATGALGLGLSSGGFATSITLNQPTSVTGANTFTVGTGLASFGGGLTVTAGATTLDGGLAVTGGTASDTLTVSGATTLSPSSFATAGVVHNAAGGLLSSSLIVDADVSSSAAIAVSKLAHGTDAQFLFSTASATVWATMSQDGYLADTGVLTVVSAHGNFAVGGNETVAGTLAVTENTNLSTLATSGAATLNSLVVTTTSALGGYVTASAGVGVAGGLTVSGGTYN
jgi:fibronectin-binding autotransporter adhesin